MQRTRKQIGTKERCDGFRKHKDMRIQSVGLKNENKEQEEQKIKNTNGNLVSYGGCFNP